MFHGTCTCTPKIKTHHHQVDSRCSTTVEILHDALVDPKGETRSVSSQYQPPTKGIDTNLKTGAPTTKTKMVIHIERDWNETCPRRKSAQRGIDDEQSQESKSCSSRRTPRIRLRSGRSSQQQQEMGFLTFFSPSHKDMKLHYPFQFEVQPAKIVSHLAAAQVCGLFAWSLG